MSSQTKTSFPGFKHVNENPEDFPNIPDKIVCPIESTNEWISRVLYKVNPSKNRKEELFIGLRSPQTIESVAQIVVDIRFYETADFKSTGMGFTIRQAELDDFRNSLLKFNTTKSKKASFGGDGRVITMELRSGTNRETFKYIMFELEVSKDNDEKKKYRFCIPQAELQEFHRTLHQVQRVLRTLKEIEDSPEMAEEAKEKAATVYLAALVHYFLPEDEYPGEIEDKIHGNGEIIAKWLLLAPLFGIHMEEPETVAKIHESTSMAIELARGPNAPKVSSNLVEAAIDLINTNNGKWKI